MRLDTKVTPTSPREGHETGCLCECDGSDGDVMCRVHGWRHCVPCTCASIVKKQRDSLKAQVRQLAMERDDCKSAMRDMTAEHTRLTEDYEAMKREAAANLDVAEAVGDVVRSLKAQLATEREARARTLAALEELSSYERKRHPPRMGGDHFPPSLRAVMKQVEAAIAASKVTP